MKKVIAVLLAGFVTLGLAACASNLGSQLQNTPEGVAKAIEQGQKA